MHYGPVDRRSQVVIGGDPAALGDAGRDDYVDGERVRNARKHPKARNLIMLGIVVAILAAAVAVSFYFQ